MNIQTKSAFIIIITLLIGILVGVLGRGSFQPGPPEHRPGNLRPQTFVERFERILDVRGDNKDTVRTILEYHFERFRTLNVEHRQEIDSLMDFLYKDVAPLLDDRELRRLDEEREKMGRRPNDEPVFEPQRRPPPPRDGPPPPRPNNQPPPGDRPPPPPPRQGN